MQHDHPSPAVAKDTRNRATRPEASETIRFLKPPMAAGCRHAADVPRIRASRGPLSAAPREGEIAVTNRNSPTQSREEPVFVLPLALDASPSVTVLRPTEDVHTVLRLTLSTILLGVFVFPDSPPEVGAQALKVLPFGRRRQTEVREARH